MSSELIKMKTIAQELNDLTFTDYYYRLMLLARSIFKWSNLPNGIDEKWIERYLFTEGSCLFFKDSTKGFIVTKYTQSSTLNYYDEPTQVYPVATNYNNEQNSYHVFSGAKILDAMGNEIKPEKAAVIIQNNDEMLPTSRTIQLFALRLAEISRTIDININAQKTPVAILCTEKQRLTLKNVYKQWNGFEPVIIGDANLDLNNGIKALKTDAPVVFDKLQIQKHAIWNEAMTFLGINNANQDKRERLVADEVDANNEQVESFAGLWLKAREKSCELMNNLFKPEKPISVEMRSQAALKALVAKLFPEAEQKEPEPETETP